MRLFCLLIRFYFWGVGGSVFMWMYYVHMQSVESTELSGQPITLTKKKKKQANDGRNIIRRSVMA